MLIFDGVLGSGKEFSGVRGFYFWPLWSHDCGSGSLPGNLDKVIGLNYYLHQNNENSSHLAEIVTVYIMIFWLLFSLTRKLIALKLTKLQ